MDIPKEAWSNIITGFFTLAAALGAIVVQQVLKRGKLIFYVSNFEEKYYKDDMAGGFEQIDLSDEVVHGDFKTEIDIFNSAEVPNSLREISIKYKAENHEASADVKDYDTGRRTSHKFVYDTVKVLNFLPKTMRHYNLVCFFSAEDRPVKGTDVWFVAKDFKGKEYRVKIGKVL